KTSASPVAAGWTNVSTPIARPTIPPTTSGHHRPCSPAAINPKLRTTTPSTKAYAPNKRTRTSNVRPGHTNAAAPKTIVSAPRSATSHQVPELEETIILSPNSARTSVVRATG